MQSLSLQIASTLQPALSPRLQRAVKLLQMMKAVWGAVQCSAVPRRMGDARRKGGCNWRRGNGS